MERIDGVDVVLNDEHDEIGMNWMIEKSIIWNAHIYMRLGATVYTAIVSDWVKELSSLTMISLLLFQILIGYPGSTVASKSNKSLPITLITK